MIFSVFGIKLRIDFLFTATVALLCVVDTQGVMYMSFAAVILHEFGHIVAMLILGMRIRCVRLSCCGVLIDGTDYLGFWQSAVVAAAGPVANIVCGLLLKDIYFSGIMLFTGIFNLVPIIGTDGGDLLRIACMRAFETKTAHIVYMVIVFLVAVLMLAVGIALIVIFKNPTLLASSVYFIAMTVASLVK